MRRTICYLLIIFVLLFSIFCHEVSAEIDGEKALIGIGISLLIMAILQFGLESLARPSQEEIVISITSEEKRLLQQMIMAEARGEPFEGKVAVGAVIINRVKSPLFPNTLKEVIFAKNQFEPVEDGSLFNRPCRESVRASYEALKGRDPSRGALYFYNREIVIERGDFHILSWFDVNTATTVIIGGHTFAH